MGNPSKPGFKNTPYSDAMKYTLRKVENGKRCLFLYSDFIKITLSNETRSACSPCHNWDCDVFVCLYVRTYMDTQVPISVEIAATQNNLTRTLIFS